MTLQTTNTNHNGHPSATAPSGATISPRSPEWQASLTEMIVEEMRNVEARVKAMAAVKRANELYDEMKREEMEEKERKETVGEVEGEGRRDSRVG